jgi:hypothetical protein
LTKEPTEVVVIGWREWVSLPDLGVPWIKVKVDTGARSSSLHAFDLEVVERGGAQYAQFSIHPLQRTDAEETRVEARIQEFRHVKSSSGQSDLRPVILTTVELCGQSYSIELTLANRDAMGFRMLFGREGVRGSRGKMLVDPERSFLGGRPKRSRRLGLPDAKQEDTQ